MDHDLVLNSFLRRYLADSGSGKPRPAVEYQHLYPGHEELIAQEYARLESPGPAAIETRIGRYRLVRELGRGGQGVVHLAIDTQLNRPVALKVLSGVAAFSDDLLARFRREAEVASRVDHPGICAVFDAGEHDGIPYIAMRYVEGETLAQRISTSRRAGPHPPAVDPTVLLIEKAARALHAAHQAGVLHRDIKPGNVMITKSSEPVILDFGLARALDADAHGLTRTGDSFGTPSYMSPEQVSGKELDVRTDVYSLGATLYEALTLHRPFEEPTREKLYEAICTRRPADPRRLNPGVNEDLKVVLDCALEVDRGRRYQTALDLAEDLRRVRALEPIRARPVGPIPRVVRWGRRNPALAAALSALFLLMLTALTVTVKLLKDARRERDSKDVALALVERLSDIKRLEDLRSQAENLWPAVPAKIPAMKSWLERAGALERALPGHQTALAALRELGRATQDGGHEAWSFSSTEQQWRHDTLARLVSDIEAFLSQDPAAGLVAAMYARLAFAETVEQETLEKPRDLWRATIAAIADAAASPDYAGLSITPQLGLVPIGRDPASRLFEFCHLPSGAVPVRGTDGRLAIEAGNGIVLVLIPGGRFEMGAIRPDAPDARGHVNLDPDARPDEGPLQQVDLAPFFMSKYEMTQAQWLRVTGTNPAGEGGGTFPLNFATFDEVAKTLPRIELVLPTEAQWEYAARARTTTPWWTGAETRSVEGAGNVADLATAGITKSWIHQDWDDGFAGPAPVGRFRANAFGLHDVIGNVWEWCRDPLPSYATPAGPGDGMRHGPPDSCAARGGSYIYGAGDARSARRSQGKPTGRSVFVGVRPARPLQTR